MARRGGENRAFTSPHGRDLLYARLVLEAMCNDTTEAGKRFAKEREDLYLRWHRLIRTIIADQGGDSQSPSIESVDEVLDYLEWHRKSHVYPKPRPLTPDEQDCLKWRTEIALEATQEIFINLGRPSQPQDWDCTEAPSFEVAFLVSETPPSGRHSGWGTGDSGGVLAESLSE